MLFDVCLLALAALGLVVCLRFTVDRLVVICYCYFALRLRFGVG